MASSKMEVSVDVTTLRETVEAIYIAAGSITAALEALATRLIDIEASRREEQ